MKNKTYHLTLTSEQITDLSVIVRDDLDQITIFLDDEIKKGDPSNEVGYLETRFDEIRSLLLLLEKTMNPEPYVMGELQTHGSVWYPVEG